MGGKWLLSAPARQYGKRCNDEEIDKAVHEFILSCGAIPRF